MSGDICFGLLPLGVDLDRVMDCRTLPPPFLAVLEAAVASPG